MLASLFEVQMKILILIASLLTFSDQCPPRPQTAKNGESVPASTLKDDRLEKLARHWIHSSEEQNDDKVQIFRPERFKEFPPSRFRMEYVFRKNGDCEWYYLSPDDAHRFKTGKWKLDPENEDLEITKAEKTERYRILELTKDKLKLKEIKPNASLE